MMVSFNWSWADYEREARKWKRETGKVAARPYQRGVTAPENARTIPPVVDEAPDVVVKITNPVDRDDEDDDLPVENLIQHCDACGKRRLRQAALAALRPCDSGACPLL